MTRVELEAVDNFNSARWTRAYASQREAFYRNWRQVVIPLIDMNDLRLEVEECSF